ncbi:LysR family transcriptional regulator [Microbispora hainanensis]|jgi:DNA-binding transcriptional LysR family regulator|uniref:LysR family transcriptional regulator n=1 Tax=Microbispora hainanensis TaxID=568844 RepID=A0ABZ1SW71_9ACTN|nr:MULTISPECIES: LysR family transcriptional regulator [Microbispora]NJP24669.1 LysR family transcriptional regulator [Microbispora sp. CL1-1]TQS14791.1 LysR family transcriptional regulator [Microbispora sp. SCL1-1]
MSSFPSVEDLRLVEAIARHGSVGAAGRELLISQPAASKRLAALERRVGERLFDRDTTGARPTPAGRALCAEAAHVLDHLGRIFDRARAAARAKTFRVGTFGSLAPLLFPALDELMDGATVDQVTDHGDRLVEWVGEGSLDAAFVAVADQMRLPATVSATPVATDRLAVLTPEGAPARDGRRPFAGLDVVAYTYDMSADTLHQRLSGLGARPRAAATAETAVRLARLLRCPAVLPRGLGLAYAQEGDRISAAPLPGRLTLFMVTRRPAPHELTAMAGPLPGRLGLRRPAARRPG